MPLRTAQCLFLLGLVGSTSQPVIPFLRVLSHAPLSLRPHLFPNKKNKQSEPIVRGYGKVSAKSNAPNVTPDTPFQIASATKVVVGTAVLLLIDQGYISSLDDDICDVLPEDYEISACRNPHSAEVPVTWRMLATHRTSLTPGIPNVNSEDGNEVSPSYGPEGGYIPDVPAAGNPGHSKSVASP